MAPTDATALQPDSASPPGAAIHAPSSSNTPFPLDAGSQPPVPAAPDPQPLPARMLNEFVYCPRLFYYEFVEGVFVESADTLRGELIPTPQDIRYK